MKSQMVCINRLLIVENDKETATYLAKVARTCGYVAVVVASYDEFVVRFKAIDPTIILLNQAIPGKDGIEFLKALSYENSSANIVITAAVDNRALLTATHLGQILGLNMAGSLSKPFSIYSYCRILKKLARKADQLSSQDIELALREGRIKPFFQPRAVLHSGRRWKITAIEALAYFCRDESSVPIPVQFSSELDDNELVSSLTDCLVRQVAAQLAAWSQQGQDLDASVNLSSSLMHDRHLPDRLQKLVREAGVDNSRLTLDVAENLIPDHSAESVEIVSRLHAKGFRLAIDNFGTGYSSLVQLYQMPYNELKIDASFASGCEMNHEARIIVEASVLLGHKLGMDVSADGVENLKTFDYLRKLGCDRQQGYFIGRPEPAESLLDKASTWKVGARRARAIANDNVNLPQNPPVPN
jgi:EAL domain-containing protein (putative c-di-GMP-specific phosphodiesterase class I)/ActR/RegA family two-component response regulator